jgi:hypothetical protein
LLVILASPNALAEARVSRVIVDHSGTILLNGARVSLDELRVHFVELKSEGGEVWYHHPNPSGEPPPMAMQVIQLIVEAQLPVRLAIDEEFTQFVRPSQ